MKKLLILTFLLLTACGQQSKITFYMKPKDVKSIMPSDTNDVKVEVQGKAAEEISKALAANIQSEKALLQKTYRYNWLLYIIVFAIGFLGTFWGIKTNSHWAYIVPIVSIITILLIPIFTLAGASPLYSFINLGILVIVAVVIFGWRGIIWQKERNAYKGK